MAFYGDPQAACFGLMYREEEVVGGRGETSMYCPRAVGPIDAIVKSWVLAKTAGLGPDSRDSHPGDWSCAPPSSPRFSQLPAHPTWL